MPEQTGDIAHSAGSTSFAGSTRFARRRTARRYLAGLSAAGLTGALVVTGAVSGSAAQPAAGPSRVITLTSSAASSAAHLTVQFRYQLEKQGKIKPLSVRYSGASRVKLPHPALILSLRPVLGPIVRRQVRAPGGGFNLILKIRDASHFSGTLPAKVLAVIGKVANAGPRRHPITSSLLAVTLASVSKRKKQVSITAPAGVQVAILVGPVGAVGPVGPVGP